MTVREVLWIASVVVLIRISDGTTYSDCMVAIEGPTQFHPVNNRRDVDYLLVNELEPAEFYCKFIHHDVDHSKYRYRAYIDVINTAIHHSERWMNELKMLGPSTPSCDDCNFNITNTEINSTENVNVTIYKTQITFSSINLDTPRLNIKCGVEYLPTGMASNKIVCASSSTFVIIPNATVITTPIICTTSAPSPSTTHTSTPSLGYISSREFAPTAAIMGLTIMIETILLIVCLFVKCKKSKITRNAVGDIIHSNDSEAGANVSKDKATHEQQEKDGMLRHSAVPDDDCTLSSVSDLQ